MREDIEFHERLLSGKVPVPLKLPDFAFLRRWPIGLDREASRWLASLGNAPHLMVGGFQMAAEAHAVKQRGRQTVMREPRPERGQR